MVELMDSMLVPILVSMTGGFGGGATLRDIVKNYQAGILRLHS
jgi:hypothetical protein